MKNEIKKQLDNLNLPSCQMYGQIYVELPEKDTSAAHQRVIDACGTIGEIRRWDEMGKAWLIITPNKAESVAQEEPTTEETNP